MHPAVALITFGVVFPAELPDKTALASLMLGSRYRPRWVFAGVAVAFAFHVGLALVAGSLLGMLPHRWVEIVVATLFLVGAVVLLRGHRGDDGGADAGAADGTTPSVRSTSSGWRAAGAGFAVIFLAEFGDLTQIVTANLAARYHDPLAVGVGATLGLWAVGGLAVLGGRRLLSVLSMTWISRLAAVAMIVLAGFGIVGAIQG